MAETIRTPVFRRYEIAEKLGSGGMGTVYKARDANLDRWVALKVLPPGLQEQTEALERFRREARALARLKHAHVAAVYDANVEHGFPYLVMEYVEGETLEQILHQNRRLQLNTVIRLGIDLAEALAHIHQHRIVHRDVKTSNIILGADGGAVLADFGIALVATLPRISHGGLGTPEYMSPEQAEGHDLDGRSDLYSLGVVLYECLTGCVPFQRTGTSLAGLTSLMQQIIEAPIPALYQQSHAVPEWLAQVVQRCLAKCPGDRFASGQELAAALRRGGSGAGRAHAPAATNPPWDDDEEPTRRMRYGRSAIPRQVAQNDEPPSFPARLTLISHADPVVAVAFSPDGRRLATASADRRVRLWDVRTNELHLVLDAHAENVLSVAFSPDGRLLATGDAGGTVHLWDAHAGRRAQTLKGHPALAMSIAFGPDGRCLASGGADGAVRIWDAHTGTLQRTLIGHRGYTMAVAYSPDGARLASAGADGMLQLWNPATGDLQCTLEAHRAWTVSIAFSPDGESLASGGADGVLRLWSSATGKPVQIIGGHPSWIMTVDFSPDGTQIVSAGRDHLVRVWDVATGHLVYRLEGHHAPVMTASYSPDGQIIASGSKDGTVRLWHAHSTTTQRVHRLRRVLSWSAAAALTVMLFWGNAPSRWSPQQARLGFGGTGTTEAVEAVPEDTDAALFGAAPIDPTLAGWTMIVASRTDQEDAERIAASLRERGYRTGVLPGRAHGQIRYRVGVGQFIEQEDALAARYRLAGRDLPGTTWVLHIQPSLSLSHSVPSP